MTVLPLLALFSAPPQGQGSNPWFVPVLMYGAIFAIFYFILIRPQQKQRQAHEQSIQTLKKGDEVVTAGGIVGKVVHIKESLKDGQPVKSAEDQVTIESGSSRLVVERGRIAKIRGAATGAPNA